MQYPVNYIVVTQGYHQGKSIDFGWNNKYGGKNQPIFAVDNGIVWKIERQKLGGNVVFILHDNGLVSIYGHLLDGSITVSQNDRVTRGERIALMGATGVVTGNHLHFGLYKSKRIADDNMLDPFLYLYVLNTQVVNQGTLDKYPINYEPTYNMKYVKSGYDLNVRTGPGTNYKEVNELVSDTLVTIYEMRDGWARIGEDQWVAGNFLVDIIPRKVVYTKEVFNVDEEGLNVRKTPNGTLVKSKSPLPNKTIVSVVEERNNFTKIGKDRYVYSPYLK